jgi:hypothetical protein
LGCCAGAQDVCFCDAVRGGVIMLHVNYGILKSPFMFICVEFAPIKGTEHLILPSCPPGAKLLLADGLLRGVHVLVCVVVTSGGRHALLAAPGACVARGRLGPGGERGRSRHPARVGRGAGLCSLSRRRSRAAGMDE